jgi:hypothetical protein
VELLTILAVTLVIALAKTATYREDRVVRRALWRTRRVMRKARVSKIAEVVDGKLACIVGRVELEGDPLISVLSRRPCVAYEIVEWHVGVRRRLVPFYIVDASGRARVDAAEAALLQQPIERGQTFEERIVEPGELIRIVGSVRVEPAVVDASEHGFRDVASGVTLTGTAKYPLLVEVVRD